MHVHTKYIFLSGRVKYIFFIFLELNGLYIMYVLITNKQYPFLPILCERAISCVHCLKQNVILSDCTQTPPFTHALASGRTIISKQQVLGDIREKISSRICYNQNMDWFLLQNMACSLNGECKVLFIQLLFCTLRTQPSSL